jgi:2-oxoisovalerate dehydrogenase E1 component alpha subunit
MEPIERYDLSDQQLRWILRNMLLQRRLDNRSFELNRQGKIPFALGSEGHEAAQAGAAQALLPGKDILVPYYRDLGLVLGFGVPLSTVFNSLFARAADTSGGRQFPHHYSMHALGLLSVSSIVAAQCPHAVGAAFAFTYRGETGRAVFCSTGEGATSEGEWHESVNFAAIHKLPIVFFVENNAYAISTPQAAQMAIRNVADKAPGYGIPGLMCDGFNPVAVYATVKEAMERARFGGGPSIVEAKVYRLLSHSTDDDDRTYRNSEEVREQRALDPVPRFEQALLQAGIIAKEELAALKAEVLRETNEATDAAEALPLPSPQDIHANVYEGAHEPWQ